MTFLLFLALLSGARSDGWIDGRSTFYGNPGDGASIHGGSCMYYDLSDSYGNGQGYFITALSDMDPDHNTPNEGCGRCYEVACRNTMVPDGYGNTVDRTSACKDENMSIFVKVTDTCPCVYPANAYSNKRWCCGDNGVRHLDMSYRAFSQLAEMGLGVIGVKFRPVPCTLWDQGTGTAQPIRPDTPYNGSSTSTGAADVPRVLAFDAMPPTEASTSATTTTASTPGVLVANGVVATSSAFKGSWGYESSWNSGNALCAKVYRGGALAFGRSSGFAGITTVQFQASIQSGNNILLQMFGPNGAQSSPQRIDGASTGAYTVGTDAAQFDKIAFKNDGSGDAVICVSNLQVA